MDVPSEYKTGGTLLLVSGAINLMTALVWVFSLIWVCVGIFWLVPAAAAAYQCFVGFQAMQGTPTQGGKMAAISGIVAGALNFNPLPLILAVVAMVNFNKPEVVDWLETRQ